MEESSLRKEASINAWKQLYDITLKLDKLEPWNDLGAGCLMAITRSKKQNLRMDTIKMIQRKNLP